MTYSDGPSVTYELGEHFEAAANPAPGKKQARRKKRSKRSKYAPPFSLRLTFEERAALEEAAGGMPLGAYIRAKLFDGELPKRRARNWQPIKDHTALGQVLGELGKSRIANNLNQLARAANTGSLPVTPETVSALEGACADVRQMRTDLIRALGLDGGGAP